MTRKDFLLIAETIRQLQGLTNIQRRAVAEQFAQKLKGTNPNFDGKRFVAACMGEG